VNHLPTMALFSSIDMEGYSGGCVEVQGDYS
jgi:hypothetical protein